jgi:hypothetical protein
VIDTSNGVLTPGNDTVIRFKTEETAKGFPMITVSVESQFKYEGSYTLKEHEQMLLESYDRIVAELQRRREDRYG